MSLKKIFAARHNSLKLNNYIIAAYEYKPVPQLQSGRNDEMKFVTYL
jgi:hypothetical protein